MANSSGPHISGAIIEVGDHLDEARTFRKKSTRGRTEQGNFYLSRARYIFQIYRPLIVIEDLGSIQFLFQQARDKRVELDNTGSSRFGFGIQKRRKALEYKSLAKETYDAVKKASDRILNDNIICEMAMARARATTVGAPSASQREQPRRDGADEDSDEGLTKTIGHFSHGSDIFGFGSSESA